MTEHLINRIFRNFSNKYKEWNSIIETKTLLEENKKYSELKNLLITQQTLLKETEQDLSLIIRMFQKLLNKDTEKIFLSNIATIISRYIVLLDAEIEHLKEEKYQEYIKDKQFEENLNNNLTREANIFLIKETSTKRQFSKIVTKLTKGLTIIFMLCICAINANSSEIMRNAFPEQTVRPIIEKIEQEQSNIKVNIKWKTDNKHDTLEINNTIREAVRNSLYSYGKGISVDNIVVIIDRKLEKKELEGEFKEGTIRINPNILENINSNWEPFRSSESLKFFCIVVHETIHLIDYYKNKEQHDKCIQLINNALVTRAKNNYDFKIYDDAIIWLDKYLQETELNAFNAMIKITTNFVNKLDTKSNKIILFKTTINEYAAQIAKINQKKYYNYTEILESNKKDIATYVAYNWLKQNQNHEINVITLLTNIHINIMDITLQKDILETLIKHRNIKIEENKENIKFSKIIFLK